MAGRSMVTVGRQSPQSVSLEGIVGLLPDLVVASLHMIPGGENDLLVQRLQSFGIPVVFSDVSSNDEAVAAGDSGVLDRLRRHMKMWGQILGQEEKAGDFVSFTERQIRQVKDRLVDVTPVVTYLEIQSTLTDCCWAAGNRIWGELLEIAGGRTLAGVTAPWFQKLQLEYLISTPHDVYIASGGSWAAEGRPKIGPELDPKEGRLGLEALTKRPGFHHLDSVKNGRVHGIWTGLISALPLNILFVERVAGWLHPDTRKDINPDQTLAEMNERFFARPIVGPLWASL